MGQVLHGSARTTEAVRRAIQHSEESLRALAKRHGINQKTVAKWKKRETVVDRPTGPTDPRSTVLSIEEEAIVVAFRRHTLLPLDDCLYALQATDPAPHPLVLHRCLQRHGISRLPEVEGDKPARRKFKSYPIGFFHIDIAEVRTEQGKLYLYVAVDRTSKFAFVQLVETAILSRPERSSMLCRGRPLQDRDRSDRQRHSVRRSAEEPLRADSPLAWAPVRSRLPAAWDRAPPHQAEPSLDERPSREDEPDHQRRNRQALPLRQP
jgi:hypothetical protein